MPLDPKELQYMQRGNAENPQFWRRLGGRPALQGLSVLDVGCGHGGLCFDVAAAGAHKVVGIDLDGERIEFAKEYAQSLPAAVQSVVDFRECPIEDVTDTFDIVISKNSFEHIDDVPAVLKEIRRTLKPGGRAFIGFSPLYNSYNGAHGRSGVKFPWGHLIFGEQRIVRRINAQGKRTIASVRDLGLNMHSLAEHTAFLRNSGMRVAYFRVNASNNPVVKLFSVIRLVPFLREYFTHNLYCVLQKPA